MSVLKYFKNTPRSPPHRATGLKCNFFSSNSQWGPWKKKGPVAPQRATGACRPPLRRQALFINPNRHSLCHFGPKIQGKSWSACRVVTSFWNGGRALLLGHVCLGKECDIWETRDRRAEQWQPVISYSQLDTLWFLFWAIRACSRHHRRQDLGR